MILLISLCGFDLMLGMETNRARKCSFAQVSILVSAYILTFSIALFSGERRPLAISRQETRNLFATRKTAPNPGVLIDPPEYSLSDQGLLYRVNSNSQVSLHFVLS